MGKPLEESDMPPLSREMHGDLRRLERELVEALRKCIIDRDLDDPQAAFEYIRTFATEFYSCYFSFYSQHPAYKEHWRPASEKFAYGRIAQCINNFIATRNHFARDSSLAPRITRTISEYAEGIEKHISAFEIAKRSLSPILMYNAEAELRASLGISGNEKPESHNERHALRIAYLARFPNVMILDICWAARQRYSEWKRWLHNAVKDDSSPDRAFREILTSGLPPIEYRRQPRPNGWK